MVLWFLLHNLRLLILIWRDLWPSHSFPYAPRHSRTQSVFSIEESLLPFFWMAAEARCWWWDSCLIDFAFVQRVIRTHLCQCKADYWYRCRLQLHSLDRLYTKGWLAKSRVKLATPFPVFFFHSACLRLTSTPTFLVSNMGWAQFRDSVIRLKIAGVSRQDGLG